MANCKQCECELYYPHVDYCSDKCKRDYEMAPIKLRYPCSSCGCDIYVLDGFYCKGKAVYCSSECLINKKYEKVS